MKRIWSIAVICALVLLCGVSLKVSAHEENVNMRIEPRMSSISTYGTELSISSEGIASVSGFVRGKAGVSSTYVKVTLQKKVSEKWTDINSWEDTNNARSTSIAQTYRVSKGIYRVSMTCSADSETKITTSAERTY